MEPLMALPISLPQRGSQFRFGDRPLDALQTLDRAASVFYVGTFSKSLLPGVRLAYVVAPSWARPAMCVARFNAACCSATARSRRMR
jgi:DNA-binding transcriptional MocR family regulator